MNELKVFSNTEFGELGVMIIDGKEFFPATQCAMLLGYKNPQEAIRDKCKGVRKTLTPTNGGTQTVNYIPEGDLYRLIVSSKLPAAEQFERWVFDDVLPSIRRTGGYTPNVEEIIAKTATAVVSEVMKQLVPLVSKAAAKDYDPLEEFRLTTIAQPKPRRKIAPGKIRKLDEKIRSHVDNMIISEQYSYRDIVNYLAQYGISVSETAICNYRKTAFTIGG